jgi:hypothetical protein
MEGCVDPRVGLDDAEKREISSGNQTRAIQPGWFLLLRMIILINQGSILDLSFSQ